MSLGDTQQHKCEHFGQARGHSVFTQRRPGTRIAEPRACLDVRCAVASSDDGKRAELSTESVNNFAILWINAEPGSECSAVASPSHRSGLETRRWRRQFR